MTVTISETSPPDNEIVSKWPEYIRKVAQELDNILTAIAGLAITDVELNNTQTLLEVGNHLADVSFEMVFLNIDSGAADINQITEGRHGQVKVMLARSEDITFSSDGNIILNQTDAELDLEVGDMITLVNVDGDQDTGADGEWRELARALSAV